jgi:phage/plasmid-like protein (TIGR03299 family)
MSANLDYSNGRVNFAFIGERSQIWHGEGNQLPDGASDDEIRIAAGLDHTYSKRPAYAHDKNGSLVRVPAQFFIARDDNDFVTSGSVSDQYNIVQPKTLQEGFSGYIAVDPNFRWSSAGSLDLGRQVFFCAEYNGDVIIAGDKHKAYLQAHTSFDTSAASTTSISMVRSVCANTVAAALGSAAAIVRRVHRTTFDPKVVTKELAKLIASIERYKHIGDAMITVQQTQDEVAAYFRKLLDVPADAKATDISTRKLNQLDTLWNAYETTCGETDKGTAWSAFQAVTRYVDHDRGTRSGDNLSENEARFLSAQFGSGAAMKQQAWNLLAPLVKPLVAVAA